MNLLGRSIEDVKIILNQANIEYTILEYKGPKPYHDADCCRVVRVVKCENNSLNLTVCAFKTALN